MKKHYTKEELIKEGYNEFPLEENSPLYNNYKIRNLVLSTKDLKEILDKSRLKKGKKGDLIYAIDEKYFFDGEISLADVALRKKNNNYFTRGSLFQRDGKAKGELSKLYHFMQEGILQDEILEISEIEELLVKKLTPTK